MTMKELVLRLAQIGSVVLVFVGFRLATQAGQGLGVIQNDGYAGSGGFLILVGSLFLGATFGFALASQAKRKK